MWLATFSMDYKNSKLHLTQDCIFLQRYLKYVWLTNSWVPTRHFSPKTSTLIFFLFLFVRFFMFCLPTRSKEFVLTFVCTMACSVVMSWESNPTRECYLMYSDLCFVDLSFIIYFATYIFYNQLLIFYLVMVYVMFRNIFYLM